MRAGRHEMQLLTEKWYTSLGVELPSDAEEHSKLTGDTSGGEENETRL